MNELLQSLLDEQRKTNQILLMLVEALADDVDEDDYQTNAQVYLNGTPKVIAEQIAAGVIKGNQSGSSI